MLRVLVTALLLAGWAGEACAQFWRDCTGPAWGVATVRSYHGDRSTKHREQHLGIGFEHVCGNWRGVGGVIPKNSNDDITLYVGGAWTPLAWRELRFGGFAGVFTGYGPLLPAAAFVGAWDGRRYGINLLIFPPYGDGKALLVLQAKWRFQ